MIRRISPWGRLTDPDTSHEAAVNASHRAATDREKVLISHYEHREYGLDDFVLAFIHGRQQTSLGKRRQELMVPKLGFVPEPWIDQYLGVDGRVAKTYTPSGSRCRVWRITPAGMRAAEALLSKQVAA
jgi:hypothetical protein